MLSRVARHSTQTITAPFDEEPGVDVTVGIVSSDGDTVVAPGTATDDGAFELTPAHTTNLDRLTATWTAGTEKVTSVHDVVGFHLITLERLRQFDPLDNTDRFTYDDLRLGRDIATYAIERACNRAFAPQLRRETVTGRGDHFLPVTAAGRIQLQSLNDGSGPLDLSTFALDTSGGFIERLTGSWGPGLYDVAYVHGEEAVDPRVSRAVGLVAADLLYNDALEGASALNPRATSQTTEDGTFSLVTAGVGSNAFSLPEVNAVVQEWRLPG